MKGLLKSLSAGLLTLAISGPVGALGLDDVTGGGDGGSDVDVGQLVSQGDGLMGRFSLAFGNMNLALANTLDALGYKEKAEQLSARGNFYAEGNIAEKDAVERDIEVTREAVALVEESAEGAEAVSDAGKEALASAVPHYVKGVYESTQLLPEAQKWADSVSSGISSLSSNPMKLNELRSSTAAPLFVATNLPSFMESFAGATNNFVAFARSNDVEVPDDISNVSF